MFLSFPAVTAASLSSVLGWLPRWRQLCVPPCLAQPSALSFPFRRVHGVGEVRVELQPGPAAAQHAQISSLQGY